MNITFVRRVLAEPRALSVGRLSISPLGVEADDDGTDAGAHGGHGGVRPEAARGATVSDALDGLGEHRELCGVLQRRGGVADVADDPAISGGGKGAFPIGECRQWPLARGNVGPERPDKAFSGRELPLTGCVHDAPPSR